jgi:hypothetical protein
MRAESSVGDGLAVRASGLLIAAFLFAFLVAAACGRPTGSGGDADAGSADDASDWDAGPPDGGSPDGASADVGSQDDAGASDGGAADASCTPIASCDNLCGPVLDPCLNTMVQCGACKTAGLVCNIETHQCITPASSCTALDAHCGIVKTSCGKHIDCGTCPSAEQECDPRTNACVPCKAVTCQDLGYECGTAWKGCGSSSDPAAQLDCGACADTNKVCNPYLHVCEPKCAPVPTDSEVCQAAKAKGVECGYITNGCGNLANCGGCPAGQACGARGVANRCEPVETSVECVVLGQNCDTIQSACGGTVSCGTCDTGFQCNANGVCGAPCVPKTCSSTDFQGKCGLGLDDGCGGKLSCGCTNGQGCSTLVSGETGRCGDYQACAAFGATGLSGAICSNGASPTFPKGDGSNLTCKCTAPGAVCIAVGDAGTTGTVVQGGATGTCCVNSATCGTSCNTKVTDTCTGADIACTCGTGVCSKDGKLVTGTTPGACCVNHVVCPTDACATSVVNECTGATIACTCGTGKHCEAGTCKPDKKCSDYSANGAVGNTCSSANGKVFDRGDGVFFSCPCTGSAECVKGGSLVDDTTKGTCCLNSNTCIVGRCNYSIEDSCVPGRTVACGCLSNEYCDTGLGQCFPLETCTSTHPPSKPNPYTNRHAGNPCSNGAATGGPSHTYPEWPRGNGTYLTCTCIDSGNVCVDSTGATVSGYVVGDCCKPATCATGVCNTQVVDSACTKKTIDCKCTGSAVCSLNGLPAPSGTPGTCCTNSTTCGNKCNTTVKNSCTNADIACPATCSDPTKHCDLTQKLCVPNDTCASLKQSGAVGANDCSVNASPHFPKGDGTYLKCDCSTGVCAKSGQRVTGTDWGLCCTITAVCGDNCNTTVADSCAPLTCPASCTDSSKHCDTAQKLCVPNSTCATYSANGKIGDKCSTVASSAFPAGNGTNLPCPCSTQSGGKNGNSAPNIQCTGSSASAAGTCTCQPLTCADIGSNIVPNDRCGNVLDCRG